MENNMEIDYKKFMTEVWLNKVGTGKGDKAEVYLHHDNKEWNPEEHSSEDDPEREQHISTMKSGHKIYLHEKKYGPYTVRTYHAYDPKTKKTTLSAMGDFNKKSGHLHKIELASSPENTLKAHKFYHHLITHHNISIQDDSSSPGNKKVWERLAKMPGVNIHGWSKGKPVNVVPHEDNEDETHEVKGGENKEIGNMHMIAHKK
jgi:hypothetical protein